MAYGQYGPDIYVWVGLSTDTKPTNAHEGQKAFEYDTGNEFKWVGDLANGSWVKYHSNGNTEVAIQDQTTRPIIAKFNQVHNSTTLATAAVEDAYTLDLTDATGFVDGTYVILFSPTEVRYTFCNQVGAAVGNVITIDCPLEFSFPAGTFVDGAITDMSVNGSGTAETFGLRGTGAPPGVDLEVDITRIIFNCTCASPINRTLFGDIAALTRGLLLRKRNSIKENIFNVKTNGEIAGIMFDFDPQTALNPAQGVDGFVARLTFNGQEKIGVAIRLPIGEDLEVLIQDNLTGLTSLEIVAEGHIVEP